MAEIKQQPRVWHLNWSDIRSLEGRGAYLYNPKGEMVAIIFEQDRPEAEGVTVKIMESLNATASPTESDKEIVERYADELADGLSLAALSAEKDGDVVSDCDAVIKVILTRLLSEYDAQRGVEKWHLRLADKLLADKQYIADMPISRESLAALIASHAPKGVDVDVLAPILWAKLALGEFKTTNSNGEYTIVITEKKLAAALVAAQGEK